MATSTDLPGCAAGVYAALPQLAKGLAHVDLAIVAREVDQIRALAASEEEACAELAKLFVDKAVRDPGWSLLAGRVQTYALRRKVKGSFSEAVRQNPEMYYPAYRDFVLANAAALEAMLRPDRDYTFDLFGHSTLVKSYLQRKRTDDDELLYLETPQYLYLRIATFLWMPDLAKIEEAYTRLSLGDYSHASPTAYNAGMLRPQLASCFLISVADTMDGIAESWRISAIISKNTGGLGLGYGDIRHSNVGAFGKSNGILPWLRVEQEILRGVDQGGRRKGSGTVFLPAWHVDVGVLLELRKNTGPEELRARDLFQALWLSDLFMERVAADGPWSLFCPKKAPGLNAAYGAEFARLYAQYEAEKRYVRQMRARELWQRIIHAQKETGMPFMLYKDACNRKSNQNNLGTICCSNLCVEIVEYTSDDEIASCNLAAVVLPQCVVARGADDPRDAASRLEPGQQPAKYRVDFAALAQRTRELVDNLNQAIDRTYYPADIPEIRYANLKNRPLGIGVQGLADLFALLDLSWESDAARQLNRRIFEVMYYAAVSRSVELAERDGPYASFAGSPAAAGKFQFDLWADEAEAKGVGGRTIEPEVYSAAEWDALRERMMASGLRNSLLLAAMPTASTAQILGNNESVEPYTQNLFTRTVLSGTFVRVNPHLVRDLRAIGMWTTPVAQHIHDAEGSVAALVPPRDAPPETRERLAYLRRKYKTAYELPQKALLDMALDRGRYICQSQSFNAWFKADVTYQQITSFHFHGWSGGAKTGMYYLRQPALTNPLNFTTVTVGDIAADNTNRGAAVCAKDDSCEACSV